MAKGKLSEDEIKWILSVESSEAQQEIHELTQANKELAKTNKARLDQMISLEKQGKRESIEWKNLDKIVRENNSTIAKNKEVISQLEGKMKITELTMTQLKKKAKDLEKQLDSTSKELHPEEYSKLEKELNNVKGRMNELKGSSKNVSEGFSKIGTTLKAAGIAALAAVAFKTVSSFIDKMKELTDESIELATTNDGILHAYQKLNQPDLLKELRTSVKGTVNDLSLMKAAVKANDWGVSFKDLGNYLAFAEMQAEKTGASIDDLMDSLLKGVARQTSKTLINLGISKEDIDAAKKRYGDFTKGLNAIIEERLKSEEDGYVSAGDKAEQELIKVQNAQLELGSQLIPLKEKWDKFWSSLQVGGLNAIQSFSKLIGLSKPLSDEFKNSTEQYVTMASTLPALAERYDELKSKVKLSKEEHEELHTVIGQLSSAVPGAISSWDQYGNAIAINTDKVYDFLKAERAHLKYLNKERIKEVESDLSEYQKEYNAQLKRVQSGGELKANGLTGALSFNTYSNEELKKQQGILLQWGEMIRGSQEELRKLSGEDLDKWLDDQIKATKRSSEARANFSKMNKAQLSAWLNDEKNAANEFRSIAQSIYDQRFQSKSASTTDKSDPNAVALKNLETKHEAELNSIRLDGLEKKKTEDEINASILDSDKVYLSERIKLLEGFESSAKKTAKKAEYKNQIVEDKAKLITLEDESEKSRIEVIKKRRAEALQAEENAVKVQQGVFSKQLSDKVITQDQYDMLMEAQSVATAENRVNINKNCLDDINALELKNGNIKADAVKEANQAVLDADSAAAAARANQQKTLNSLVKDFKSQFKLTTVDEDLTLQLQVLEASYQARKQMAIKQHLDTKELDSAYLKAKEQLNSEYEQRIYQIRSQYGLVTQQGQLNNELILLKQNLDAKLISQKDYENAVKNLKRDSFKTQFDYYKTLFSDAVTALQQAEMDNIDAKYDVEIQAAQGNSKKVAALEKEKEQKKLNVQKKYADAQFAVKASQIIADTAVSIMKAFADLGPVAGTISAALLGITGIAQLASANAERKKIKNMKVSGAETGGYIDVTRAQDGKVYRNAIIDPDKRGYVDRPTVLVGEGDSGRSLEWVASNATMQNPSVASFINILDKHQQAGTIRTLDMNQLIRANMAGLATGGYVSKSSTTSIETKYVPAQPIDATVYERLAAVLEDLQSNGLPAYMVLSQFDKAVAQRDKARSIGSKNRK
jgi:hypothetical protein